MSMSYFYVELVNSHGVLRGWVVPARSRWAARRTARRQLRRAFGGRWRPRYVSRATDRQLRDYWPDLADR